MKHYKTHHLKEAPALDPIKKFKSVNGNDQQDEAKSPLSFLNVLKTWGIRFA
jgi:hypothetical protein